MRRVVQEQRMIRRLSLCLITPVLLGACTQFPALDRTLTPALEAADYPALVPLEPLLAQATAGQVDAAQTKSTLTSRVSRLRARAASLRNPVLTSAERQRLSQGRQ